MGAGRVFWAVNFCKKRREKEKEREEEGNNGKGNGSVWQTTIGLKYTTNAPKRDWNRIAMIERQQ